MPEPPVVGVGPDVAARRERRIRPRVPGPGGGLGGGDHPAGVDARHRVVRRLGPVAERRLEEAPLHRVVAPAAGEVRQEALGRLRVVEDVRLVRPAVDRRAADLGEADRLALRDPRRRRAALDPARPVAVRVRPPAADVLVAEHPGLPCGAVGDRRADLRLAVGGAGVEPVEALAALDVAAQVVEVGDRVGARGVEMVEPVAPVGERHVVVDADEVDRVVRPERVEVEEDVARAVLRVVPEVLRPVGGVAELGAGPEDRRARRPRGRRARRPPDRSTRRSRTCVSPRSSEPIRKASTPPAAAQRCA